MGKNKKYNRVSKSVTVETQQPEVDQIHDQSSKKQKSEIGDGDGDGDGNENENGVHKWHSDVSKDKFVQTNNTCNATNGWLSETENDDYSRQTSGLWHGHAVGQEAEEFLQTVEGHYPTTFEGAHMRSEQLWVPILKHFHLVIKRFIETSMEAVTEPHISTLREDLKELERFGFNLSWAHQRLNMVEMIRFGDDPLRKELQELQESLKTLNERLVERRKELMEAYDMLKKVRLAYENINDARIEKAREVARNFGVEYDRVLKGPLGFEMLPGY